MLAPHAGVGVGVDGAMEGVLVVAVTPLATVASSLTNMIDS